jgi:hypothetical protein
MGASQRAHRVSMTLFSLVPSTLSSPAPYKTFNSFRPQADAPSDLWQTQCLRGMVFARL